MSGEFIAAVIIILIVVGVAMWMAALYTKRTSGVFKELASELGLDLKSVGKNYTRVEGTYKGRDVGIGAYEDCKDFVDSTCSSGKIFEKICFGEDFTALRVSHKASIKEPYQLDSRTVVGKDWIFHRFESKEAKDTEMSKDIFISAINKIVELAEKLELEHSPF